MKKVVDGIYTIGAVSLCLWALVKFVQATNEKVDNIFSKKGS